jgi:hypothetical protein
MQKSRFSNANIQAGTDGDCPVVVRRGKNQVPAASQHTVRLAKKERLIVGIGQEGEDPLDHA